VKINDDGSRWFEFEETPCMSTYLIAIIVGKFETYQTQSKEVIVTAYAQVGRVD